MPKNKNWIFYHPKFDYIDKLNDYNLPWIGHVFFAYDLVKNSQPNSLVELGTFKGTSFYSMCQAVLDSKLHTKLFAVDTWEGDDNAGYYGDEVYGLVKMILRTYYRDIKYRLLKTTFDEAVKEFEDGSIDLLHIDGLHTYEAVKHDYDTWKSKVSKTGIIMFHDISIGDYGVWKVWEEVKKENDGAMFLEFKHSAGLGVMIRNPEIINMLEEHEINDFYNYYQDKSETYRSALEKSFLEKVQYKNALSALEKANEELKKPKDPNTILRSRQIITSVLSKLKKQ